MSAALMCDNYVLNSYTDWFLPSINELNLMYMNLRDNGCLGGFKSAYYWSSFERSVCEAWGISFARGDLRSLFF